MKSRKKVLIKSSILKCYSQYFLICSIVNCLFESIISLNFLYVIFVCWSLRLRFWYCFFYLLIVLCRSITSLSSWSSCPFWSIFSWFLHTGFFWHYCVSHVVYFILYNWSTSLRSVFVYWINSCWGNLYDNIFYYFILLIRLLLLNILRSKWECQVIYL